MLTELEIRETPAGYVFLSVEESRLAAISDLIATARARLEERKAEKKGKAR